MCRLGGGIAGLLSSNTGLRAQGNAGMVGALISPPFLMVSMLCCSCQGPLVFWSTEGSGGIPSTLALPKHTHKGSEGTATEKANPKTSLSFCSCFLSLQTLHRNQVLGTGNSKANALCWWVVREVSLVLSPEDPA